MIPVGNALLVAAAELLTTVDDGARAEDEMLMAADELTEADEEASEVMTPFTAMSWTPWLTLVVGTLPGSVL